MTRSFRCFLLSVLCVLSWISPSQAEEDTVTKKLEDTAPIAKKQTSDASSVNSNAVKRAKLTEEQALNQLKYMMVQGFARIEKEVARNGTFPPIGLTLSPDVEFKAVIPDIEEKLPPQVVLVKLAESMAAIAQTRSMWAVGIMYIRAIQRDDGTYAQRIIVMAEHIAGWARHWAYPFKVENGEVKLGLPTETSVEPIYYIEK